MAGQKHFLRTPYGAYHKPPTPEEDAELTHVERGSACGEYLRRFWQPIAIASEVGKLAFRSSTGQVCARNRWLRPSHEPIRRASRRRRGDGTARPHRTHWRTLLARTACRPPGP